MYSDEEKDVGIESIDKAKSNLSRGAKTAYMGVRFVTDTVSKTKKTIDSKSIRKSNPTPNVANNSNVKSVSGNKIIQGKSVSKSIISGAAGAIRINGRLVEILYDKNSDNNLGANAVLATYKNVNKTVDVVKDTANTVKTGYKISKKATELAIKAGKYIGGFLLTNPIVLVVLLICVVIIFLASNSDDDEDMLLMFSGLSTDIVITDEESIDKYKELLVSLDKEFNYSVSHGNYKGYDDVVINGSADTSLKEILSLFAVDKEQDIEFNDLNSSTFSSTHSKMYKIETDVSTYFCDGCSCPHSKKDNCPGNCRCLGHSRLTINVVQFTFDEMLDILNFSQDKKDMAKRFLEKDYKDIYSNWGD